MCDLYYRTHFETPLTNLQGWKTQSEEIDNILRGYFEQINRAINYVTHLEVTVNIKPFEELLKQVHLSITPDPDSEYYSMFHGSIRQTIEAIQKETESDCKYD